MTTIKTTTKRKIASITLPIGIKLRPEGTNIIYICTQSLFKSKHGDLINRDVLLKILLSELGSVIYSIAMNKNTMVLNDDIIMEEEKTSFSRTYNFYKEVEEEVEIFSFKQGVSVLKDIYHINA